MAVIGKSDLLTPEGHRGHRRSPASKRLMKSHMLNRNYVKLVSIGPVDAEL